MHLHKRFPVQFKSIPWITRKYWKRVKNRSIIIPVLKKNFWIPECYLLLSSIDNFCEENIYSTNHTNFVTEQVNASFQRKYIILSKKTDRSSLLYYYFPKKRLKNSVALDNIIICYNDTFMLVRAGDKLEL